MRKWLFRFVLIVALAGGAYALKLTVFAAEPVAVDVYFVERGRVEDTITNSKAGTVEARRRARLSTGTSGIVVSLDVRRGQHVAAGEQLLRLDDATPRAQLVLAERALTVTETQHARTCILAQRAERELERNRKLAEDKIISIDLVDELESALELALAECGVASADVERARAAAHVAQVELDKTVLRAPFDAIVAEVSVELGEWVTPSVPLLAAPDVIDAIDQGSIYVSAPMDEVDAGALRPGLVTRVTLDPYAGRTFPGRVVKVAPYVLDVEQQNRTLEVEVELDDAGFARTLLPGTSADVEIILAVHEDVLRVPTATLLEGGRVLALENGSLVERDVVIGMRNWDFTEIVSGLEEGEPVVTNLDRAEVQAGAEVAVFSPEGGEP